MRKERQQKIWDRSFKPFVSSITGKYTTNKKSDSFSSHSHTPHPPDLIIWAEKVRHGEADGGDEDQHGAHAEPQRASSLGAEVRDEGDHA